MSIFQQNSSKTLIVFNNRLRYYFHDENFNSVILNSCINFFLEISIYVLLY